MVLISLPLSLIIKFLYNVSGNYFLSFDIIIIAQLHFTLKKKNYENINLFLYFGKSTARIPSRINVFDYTVILYRVNFWIKFFKMNNAEITIIITIIRNRMYTLN